MRRFQLPDSFETRFVVGRVLFLIPVLSLLLLVFWRIHSSWLWLFALKYVIAVGIGLNMAIKKSSESRRDIEKHPDIYTSMGFWVTTDILPISAAIAIVGSIVGALSRDWRWIPTTLILGGLMWFGLSLRWLIYDRWLNKELANSISAQ